MADKIRSYEQGIRDTLKELGIYVHVAHKPDVDEDAGELDVLEYQRGQIRALADHIKRSDAAAQRVAHEVSCRANGIIPD